MVKGPLPERRATQHGAVGGDQVVVAAGYLVDVTDPLDVDRPVSRAHRVNRSARPQRLPTVVVSSTKVIPVSSL